MKRALLAATLACFALAQPAAAQNLLKPRDRSERLKPGNAYVQVWDKLVSTVQTRFYDPRLKGADFAAAARKYRAQLRLVKTDADFLQLATALLNEKAGSSVHYLATGQSTGGDFGLYRWNMGPDPSGPSPHFHRTMTESFFVLNGLVTIFDGREWVKCGAGDYVHVPAGGLHGFRNEDGAAEMLLHFAPGAPREAYFEGLADRVAGMSDPERAAFMLDRIGAGLIGGRADADGIFLDDLPILIIGLYPHMGQFVQIIIDGFNRILVHQPLGCDEGFFSADRQNAERYGVVGHQMVPGGRIIEEQHRADIGVACNLIA